MQKQATRLIALTAAAWIVIAAPARTFDAGDQQAPAPAPPSDPRPYFTEPAIAPDRSRSRSDRAATCGRCRSPAVTRACSSSHAANESHPTLLARRQDAGLRLRSHGRRRHLPADARDRRPAPADVRRRQRAARRMVARRPVDLLLVELARDRRQRHLSRPRLRRHADAGERRSLHERVRRRAVAGRQEHRVQRPRQRSRPVVAQGPLAPGRVGNLDHAGLCRRRATRRSSIATARTTGRCGAPTAAASSSCPIGAARRTSGCSRCRGQPKQITQFRAGRVLWPDISDRRPHDRLRARLLHLVARRGLGPRGRRCRFAVAARRSVR